MTDDLYERYKEALRVGHVAVLRGALDEACDAYRTASGIAPSRALPHTSLGGVLLRRGHLEDALVEFAAAVARGPHDEGALLGQAEALTAVGQRVDAALVLDHVSEVQEAAGRLPEAADTLRRAMELEESAERSRRQRGLLRQIRLSDGDQAAEQLLARALRLRDEPTGPTPDLARLFAAAVVSDVPVAPSPELEAAPSDGSGTETAPEPAAATVEPASATAELPAAAAAEPAAATAELPATPELPALMPELPAEAVGPAESDALEPAAVESAVPGTSAPAFEPLSSDLAHIAVEDDDEDAVAEVIAGTEVSVGESQHPPTGDELLATVEAAELSGDMMTLRLLLVWTARAYAREGKFEAGLDAAHRLLDRAPNDVDAHLVLVELYVARDWNSLAIEKLGLMGRLSALSGDADTHARVGALAARAFPREDDLLALCS